MIRIEYKKGQRLGDHGVVFLNNVNGAKARTAKFKCPYCGVEFDAQIGNVKSGHTRSCGCQSSRKYPPGRTHGLTRTKLYNVWRGIKSRCHLKTSDAYQWYGARGISVCDEWRFDFKSFHDYVVKLPNYNRPGYSIDRIENEGDYEPGNLRMATPKEQASNRRERISPDRAKEKTI
ncbi:hypothetical protein KA005_51125 [bacterium]|nr:hypothetical protein [bacterium]